MTELEFGGVDEVFFVRGWTSESTKWGDCAMRVNHSMLVCAMFIAALILFNFNALAAHTPDHHWYFYHPYFLKIHLDRSTIPQSSSDLCNWCIIIIYRMVSRSFYG